MPTVTTAPTQNPTAPPAQSDADSAVSQLNWDEVNWIEVGAFAGLGIVVALLVAVITLLHSRIRVLEQKQNDS
jgi:hypothetical protein